MGAKGKKMKDYRQAQIVRLDIIAGLYKRGYSYREIRNEVMARLDLKSYSLETVHKDIGRLLKEWRDTRIENFDHTVQLELERIDEIIKEAWAAWDKSKTDYERKKAKQQGIPGGGENGGNIIASGTPEELMADPASVTGQFLAEERQKRRAFIEQITK